MSGLEQECTIKAIQYTLDVPKFLAPAVTRDHIFFQYAEQGNLDSCFKFEFINIKPGFTCKARMGKPPGESF